MKSLCRTHQHKAPSLQVSCGCCIFVYLYSGNFLGIANVLMQLRKVCNHPDLFEGRPIISAFNQGGIDYRTSSLACRALEYQPLEDVDLSTLNLRFVENESMSILQVNKTVVEMIDAGQTNSTACSKSHYSNA